MTRRLSPLATALAVAALALVLVPAGASAHALLLDSVPQRGATLREQPRQVVLRFSESVEANFGALRVFDARAERVDDGRTLHPGASGARLAVGLKPGLPNGTYVATYRAISADGHPVAGGLVFSVGAPGDAAAQSVSDLIGAGAAGPVTQALFGAARGLTYLATAIALGGVVFLLAVWLPALRATGATGQEWAAAVRGFERRTARLLLGAAAVGVVGGIAAIVLQGATAGATSGWAALAPAVVGDVLGTRFGEVWGLRVLAFALVAGAVALASRGRRRAATALAVAPALLIALAPALAGHASAQPPVALLFSLDVAHVLAMSAWIGGLVLLLFALPAATRRLDRPDRTRLLAAALLRFSPLALGCVALLVITGTLQAIEHVGSWDALIDSGFGRAVVVKAVLLVVLAGLGAVNRRRAIPRLRRLAAQGATAGAAGHLLRRALRAEVALLVVVLAVTSALVSYPPPSSYAGGPFSGSARLGPLRMEVTADPARVGPNELHLYLLRASDGTPFAGTQELTLTLALPSRDIGPLSARAREAGPGHYVIDTVAIAPAGEWRLAVTSRVSEFDQYEAAIVVPVR